MNILSVRFPTTSVKQTTLFVSFIGMIKILLIRHALTNSVGKRLSGRLPGLSLNEEGKGQVKSLVYNLSDVSIDAIYSSPLERAVETASPLATSKNLAINISDDFLELDFGDWTNRSIEELRNDNTFQLFNSFRSSTRIPGGELMMEAQLRFVKGLEKLNIRHANATVAVVSHADMIKSAVAYYAGIHPDMINRLEISPASVSILELYDDTAKILLLNYTGKISL